LTIFEENFILEDPPYTSNLKLEFKLQVRHYCICLCYCIQRFIFGTSCFLSWRYRMQ